MRIAIVVRNLDVGGIQRVSVDLANAFLNTGEDSHLIVFESKKATFFPDKNVKLHYLEMKNSLKKTVLAVPFIILGKLLNAFFRRSFFLINGLLMSPLFLYKLKKIEEKYGKFDLIIVRGNGAFELLWPIHDERIVQVIESMYIGGESKVARLYSKLTLNNKNLVAVSNGVKEKIQDILIQNKIQAKTLQTIFNPLDKEAIEKKSIAYEVDLKEKYIVHVGRILGFKNLELLIDAYNYARKHLGLEHYLVLVGDGENRKVIEEKVVHYELTGKVIFIGSLENPFPWIKNASLLVLTSFAEGFGMVLSEALACHTKVISTKAKGGVSDIMVGDLGNYLVDFNIKGLAKKMVDTINEETKWNFDKYIDEFQSEKIANKFKELYL